MIRPFLLALVVGVPAFAQSEEPPLPLGLESPKTKTQDPEPALPEGLGEPQEPELPPGLGGSQDPELPPGLGEQEPGLPEGLETQEPELPPGLSNESAQTTPDDDETDIPDWLSFTGFLEGRAGVRTQRDPYQDDFTLGEARFHLQSEANFDALVARLTTDLLFDPVFDHHTPKLEEGRGFFDLREAYVSFTPVDFLDVKAGRQILTWGTGDLVFLNDLFPKDWQSFLLGRHVEYLKAPSDAIKTSIWFDADTGLELVTVPRFDADRYISGERVSFFNPALGRRSGENAAIRVDQPDHWIDDAELHARLSTTLDGVELAAYAYRGFWKSPAGISPNTGKFTFPDLDVYGASVRAPLASGVANAEFAWYDSVDDRSGQDPFVRNSEWRFLLGYERDVPEIANDLTLSAQYYVEWMMDHGAYRRSNPTFLPEQDEVRHVVTTRITKRLDDQRLTLSLFTFYSPSDGDAYLRPYASYKIDDQWSVEAGANVFFGLADHTFYNQFALNSNVYFAVRMSF
ncbi:MAG: hypothetical protein H6834_04825 [Planctomycetes bacterium]|nr:hypothetical protein [Planctomycetota bacterium]